MSNLETEITTESEELELEESSPVLLGFVFLFFISGKLKILPCSERDLYSC